MDGGALTFRVGRPLACGVALGLKGGEPPSGLEGWGVALRLLGWGGLWRAE